MDIELETICIRVTTRCNMKCKHCWAEKLSKTTDIDPNELLDFVSRIKPLGLRHVSLSGGEPTLYPHLYFLIGNLVKKKYTVSITTNGTSPTSLLAIFRQANIPNTSKLKARFSIDGWRTIHDSIRGYGAYESTVEEARRVSDELGGVGINTVVIDEPQYLEEILSDFSFFKITDWALITPIARGRLKDNQHKKNIIFRNIVLWQNKLKEMFPFLKVVIWDYLSHPNGGILIEADGTIKMPGITEKDDIVIGHIGSARIASLRKHIFRRLEKDPVAYFTLQNL